MQFTDIFIQRPVLACTVSLLIIVLGIISFLNMPIRQFPKIDSSVVTVTVSFPGANADLMEGFVATPIENAISGIDGLDYITSTNTLGSTSIAVNLQLGYDINQAVDDVSTKVSSVRWELPDQIEDPVVQKQDANAQPILWLAFGSDSLSSEEITDYLLRVVQPEIQMQNGVSSATVIGGREYAMRIWLNPQLMAAHHVTPTDISQALNNNNIQAAAGRVEGELQEMDIYTNTDLTTPEQFDNILIKNDNGHVIHIKDIGQARLGNTSDRASVYVNDKETVFVGVFPQSDANPLAVAKEVKKLMPSIQASLPNGIHGYIFWDSSIFITQSLKEVRSTLIEACIFVFIVIFMMMGSFRAVFVPVITIPVSIIGAMLIMFALHFTINVLTLLAFVLAIGLVVDDAIVVLENIHRHLEDGISPKKAAIVGAREIVFAIIATTITLAIVYTPIGFMTGLTGKLFTEFAFSLVGAVIISGITALTLSPMMCSKFYKQNEDLNAGFAGKVNRTFTVVRDRYKHYLTVVLNNKKIIIILGLIVYAFAYFLFTHTSQELAPTEDQGVIITQVTEPADVNIFYTQDQTQKISNIFKTVPEVQTFGMINGYPNDVNSAMSFAVLKLWNQRKRSDTQIINSIFPQLMAIPQLEAFAVSPPALPGLTGLLPFSIVLKTTGTYADLEKVTRKLMDDLAASGGFTYIDTDLKIDKPQVFVDINRKLTADLGIPISEIADAFSIGLSEPITTRFNMQGRNYEVLPEIFRNLRDLPTTLNNINVRSMSGQLVPLSTVASIKEQVVPRQLNHFQQLRSSTIFGTLASGFTMGDALNKANTLASQDVPKGIQLDYSDQSRQYIQTAGQMSQLFIFAIIFIYLILCAQFESFIDPFVIMLSVPLAIAGALMCLRLYGGTLNIYTQIGLVTLIGLITKNGILIVDFANKQQEQGKSIHEAIINAAAIRLRPILMTTFCMVLGVLPLALASGAGAESRRQMGIILLGGMSFGTLLTLFIIPTAYYLLATKKHKTEFDLDKM